MNITGILDNCLNGQLCIRGFLKIKDLAKISKPDMSYQRDPILSRHDISDFLEKQAYLFFPEIILGYKLKYDIKNDTPIQQMMSGKKFKTEDGVVVTSKLIKDFPQVVSLQFPAEYFDGNQPFHRIDGNHRLIAAEKSTDVKVENMNAPFCIIIGLEPIKDGKSTPSDDSLEFDKAEKVFFYNINTKTIPLTSEENLKVMIDDDSNFSEQELREVFGGNYPVYTRKLIKDLPIHLLTHINISAFYRTFYNKIFRRLEEKGFHDAELIVNKVRESVLAVNQLYSTEKELAGNRCQGLLEAFIYYHVEDTISKYERFKNWIIHNNLFDVNEITAESLIRIFDKVYSTEIKVFVAMPYFEGDKNILKEYNKIYQETIAEIREKHKCNISIFDIMDNHGATQDQIQDIINKIKACDILVADITDNNANVSYELGWARALDKKVILIKKKNSPEPKSDYRNDTYHEYDDNCRSISLKEVINDNILDILEKNYGLIKS